LIEASLLSLVALLPQKALVPGTFTSLAVIATTTSAGLEVQFDVPSDFAAGTALLSGHYLDNRCLVVYLSTACSLSFLSTSPC